MSHQNAQSSITLIEQNQEPTAMSLNIDLLNTIFINMGLVNKPYFIKHYFYLKHFFYKKWLYFK